MQPSDTESESVAELVRCSHMKRGKQCNAWFPSTLTRHRGMPAKTCDHHYEQAKRKATKFATSVNGKAYIATWWKGSKGRAAQKRSNQSASHKQAQKRWWKSPNGHAKRKEQNTNFLNRVNRKMSKMIREGDVQSTTVAEMTNFKSNKDVRDHFESTWDRSWMNWDNYGQHRVGAAYKTRWQIGHWVPRSAYDQSDRDDIRKSLSPQNLYAQCARENNEASDRVPPSVAKLLEIKPIWPAKCNGDLDTLLAMFSKTVPSDLHADTFDSGSEASSNA
mgnify:FL=1